MVRKTAFLALFLLVGAVFFNSCEKEDLSSRKEILSFIFEASKNAQLDRNYLGEIVNANVSAEIAFASDLTNLIPTIGISPRAKLDPPAGVVTDFSQPKVYTVTAEDGSSKSFTINVATAPAPYIGHWKSSAIDFGSGLMHVYADITADGQITLEFVNMMTGEKDGNSFQGTFNPISRADTDIMVEQTHHWMNDDWCDESCYHTMMYHIINPQAMTLYYCICYPKANWLFQMNLTIQ